MVLVPIIVRPLPGQSAAPVMRILGTSTLIAFDGLPPHQRRYLAYLVEWTLAMRPERPSGLPAGPQIRSEGPPVGRILDVDTFIRLCFDGQWMAFSEAVVQHDPDVVYYAEEWTGVDLSIVTVPMKVLWLLRDPRDAWACPEDEDHSVSLEDFIASVREHSRHERTEEDLVVRCEDLIRDPASEVGRLSDWLGVSLDDSVSLEPAARGTAAGDRLEAVDASASERRLITRELANVLEGWGYSHQD